MAWFNDKILLGLPARAYLRSLLTPANVAFALILAVGVPVLVYRFAFGLGAATNLTQTTPWGLWIGFDMLGGVALAAGGYTLAAAVYLFGLSEYRPVVRPAILTGFLGYLFAIVGLMADLGRPWRIVWPVFSHGTTSVMFEVAWCVILYSAVLALEFSLAFFEWLGWKRVRRAVAKVLIALTILGVVLSTLHQSSLGSLFLLAPGKLHPLWYSPYIPIYFFVSSIIAGLSMVIVESGLSHRIFRHRLGHDDAADTDRIVLGLGKGAAVVLFAYFFLKLHGIADGGNWRLLATGWGAWFLLELVGFVLLPCALFVLAARRRAVAMARAGAAVAVIGIVLNRLNVAIIAFNWRVAPHYRPSWMEIVGSITIVTIGLLAFRWIVNRMPVLQPHPEFPSGH